MASNLDETREHKDENSSSHLKGHELAIVVADTKISVRAASLCARSAYFENLLEPHPSKLELLNYELHLDDVAGDWQKVLPYVCGTKREIPSGSVDEMMPLLLAMLRIGHKYDIELLKAIAMPSLEAMVGSERFLNNPKLFFAVAPRDAIELLDLVLAHQLKLLLPMVSLLCAQTEILANWEKCTSPSGRRYHANHEIALRLIRGRSLVLDHLEEIELPRESAGCMRKKGSCLQTRQEIKLALRRTKASLALLHDGEIPLRDALCASCQVDADEIFAKGRGELVNRLPFMFDPSVEAKEFACKLKCKP